MTGKPFKVKRVVLSETVKKQSEEGDYFDKLASESIDVKAAASTSDKKPTYENTDNKTRTVGGTKKGMVEEPGGFRYEAKSKWSPGKTLKLNASRKSRFSLSNEPNIGWVEDSEKVTPEQYINYLRTKPSIRLRKYKVNKNTNEIIEGSEETLDPFSLNGDKTVSESSLNEKRLPGMALGGRVRSLVARAAGKFGVIVDENGKFRCPPGTPAANQFTDMTGKNCFVFVADQIVAHARNIASGLSSGDGIKNTAKNLYEFISWLDNGGIPGLGRTVWRDENGKRIRNIKKWREARATQFGRTFVNGMVRAQDRLEQQDKTISELLSGLGIDLTDDKKRTNADLIEAFDKLIEMGLWDITIDGRMDEATVRTLIGQRLAAIPGFSKLSPERKRALIEADVERWYTNERAMLEAALDHFVLDPEMAKKIGSIQFETKIPGRDAMDEASTHFYFGSESGELRSQIRIDLPEIMKNQEAELPQLSNDERLRIDVIGAKNDSEAAATLSDFLVTVDGHSKTLAGMVEERAFARHIMKHEISHTIQGEAVAQMVKKQIEDKGSVSVRFSDGKIAQYSDMKDMPSDAIIALMKRPSPDVNLEALAKVISRTDVVGFLAGDYPKMYFNDKDGLQLWAVEALAELWALRDLGIIYGDDIDAALEWMDNVSDGKYAPERIRQTNAAAALKIDPPETGSRPFKDTLVRSMADAAKFKKEARKRELDKVRGWASNRDTDESQVFERAAHLARIREDLVNEFVEAEKAGIPADSPEMRRKAEKVFELDQESKALESAWLSRFALSDSKNKSAYLRRFRSSVEEKRYAEGTLSKQRMDEIRKERLVVATKEAAQEMSVEELSDLIVSQNISSMEKGLTEEAKSEILEAKKAAMAVLREKVIREGDSRSWNKTRRDIQKRVDEIINPPVVDTEAEAAKFKKETRKRELKNLKDWASNSATEESEIFERAASLTKMREDLADEFVKAERAGVPTDSPEMREKAERVVELEQESRALESAWMSRFALDDSKNSAIYRKRFRDSVESRRYEQETLPKERMVEIRKQRAIEAARETAQNMSIDELTDLVVSQGASPEDVDVDKDKKSEMLAVKKAILNILKEKVSGDGDTSSWARKQKEIQRRIRDTKTPPDTLPMKRPKKFRGDRAAETYASEHFREQMKGMTISEVNALAELSDSNKTEIAQSLWDYQRDRALDSINRRHRNLQSQAAKIDPTSREQGSVDDQIKNILVPALTAIDKSIISDDIEMEAIIPMPSAEEVSDIDSAGRIEMEGLVTGDVLTAQRPALGSAIKNPDGSDVMFGDRKMQRVVIQVPKGSKGTFPSWSFDRDERGTNSPQKLTIPPGALRVVGVRDDGTVITRVIEQKSAIETIEKFALPRPRRASSGGSNVDKDGISRRASKSAKRAIASKSTKDSIAPKREKSSRAKKINKTESKRTTIASRGEGLGAGDAGRKTTRTRTPATNSPEGSGLSSGRAAQPNRAESIRSKKAENIEKVSKKAEDSKQDIEKLEKVIKELEENGNWIGGDLGVVLGMSRDTRSETIHVQGTAPNNRTREQLGDSLPQVIEAAKLKLDRAKKEAELQGFLDKNKKIRNERGTLDLEDIPDEIKSELENETKRILAMSPEERRKILQPDGYPDEVAVVHVGASELDGGVLNPGRTVGELGAGGIMTGAGNTGALNQTAIDMQKEKIDSARRQVQIMKNIADNPSDNFTVSTSDEKRAMSEIGFPAQIGETYNIAEVREKINEMVDAIEKRIQKMEKPLRRAAESNMGFLSAYELDGYIVSAGYFGRNSATEIPHDVAVRVTEFEKAILKKKESVVDSFMYDRWLNNLRGGAHLVIGKSEEDITSQLGPSGESQILGVNKPSFSFSARTFDSAEIDKVSVAIMARAMKIHKEGRKITPEAVLSESL